MKLSALETGDEYGWESIFYFSAVCNFIFVLFWMYYICDSPEAHSTISESEKEYIIKHRRTTNKDIGMIVSQFFCL